MDLVQAQVELVREAERLVRGRQRELRELIEQAEATHRALRDALALVDLLRGISFEPLPHRLARTERALAIWDRVWAQFDFELDIDSLVKAAFADDPEWRTIVAVDLPHIDSLVKAAFAADTADVNPPDRAQLIGWSPNPNSPDCWLRNRIRQSRKAAGLDP